MNLSLERFYRQFSGEPLTLQTVIDKIRDGSFRLYIPTPQSEDQPGTIAQIKASLPHIANIVRAPYITLKTEHPKVRAERASALSPEGIRETVRDGGSGGGKRTACSPNTSMRPSGKTTTIPMKTAW